MYRDPNSQPGGEPAVVFKQTAHPETKKFDFVMSDSTVDRYGDVVEDSGWDLNNFQRHPIALFNHDINQPIGLWKNVRVERGRLVGRLVLAEGAAPEIDKLAKLVDMGVLAATSVGFRAIEREPIKEGKGVRYKRHELLECSLVSVPANANALQVARGLNLSDEMTRRVFGVDAATAPGATLRGSTGVHAETSRGLKRGGAMEPIAKKVEIAQTKLDELRGQLTAHLEQAGEEPDDTAQTVTEELNGRIANASRTLDNFQEAERQLASRAVQVVHERKLLEGEVLPPAGRRPFAAPAEKEPSASDRVLRVLVGHLVAGVRRKWEPGITPIQCIAERYGSDGKIDEKTKGLSELLLRSESLHSHPDFVFRTATAQATTFTSGWASQIAGISVQGFLELLMPASVFPGLASRSLRLSFGRNGTISVPYRVATPTLSGAFVLEGAAIPVKQGAVSSKTFTPRKMGVISTFTRELSEHSTPDIEQLIRNAMQEDTAVILDTRLLDATAGDTIRPPGIRNGVSVTTATAGGGFAALIADIKALLNAVNTIVNGNLRRPVWIMNPAQAISISMTQNAGGDFPFKQEINNNTLSGYPVIVSGTVAAGMVILIDAADFVVIEGNAPRFDVSDVATLHMEDTAPGDITTGAGPTAVAVANVAAPVRSMFQTDSIALRMVFDVNWGHLRTTPALAWTTAVTW